MNYIGTAAIGAIIGFYAGAQELLGIQSEEEVVQPPAENTPPDQETEQETPTEDPNTNSDDVPIFEEDFNYTATELAENGWNVDGEVSITDSRLTADARSNTYAAITIPSGFTGTWELNGVQNNVEGRGLRIRFAVDLPEDDLDASVDEYLLSIRQLPDGIGNDYEGNNVALTRSEDGEGTSLFDPDYDHEGEIHDYRIENDDGQFQFFIDGEQIGEYTDQSGLYEDVTQIKIRMDGVEQYIDHIRQEQ